MTPFKSLVLIFALCIPRLLLASTPADAPVIQATPFEQAITLMHQQQWSQAAALFKQIIQQQAESVAARNNLAIALLKEGDADGARQALEQAVTALPEFKIAQQNRQALYDYLAAQAYDQALGKKPERPLPELELITEQSAKPADTNEQEKIAGAILQKLNAWAKAWSNGDVNGYFSVYAADFQPQKNIASDYNDWHRGRLLKLRRRDKPDIRIENATIFLNEAKNQAIAEFVQQYRSSHYGDTVIKQLRFVLHNGRWLIQSERVLEQLQ